MINSNKIAIIFLTAYNVMNVISYMLKIKVQYTDLNNV